MVSSVLVVRIETEVMPQSSSPQSILMAKAVMNKGDQVHKRSCYVAINDQVSYIPGQLTTRMSHFHHPIQLSLHGLLCNLSPVCKQHSRLGSSKVAIIDHQLLILPYNSIAPNSPTHEYSAHSLYHAMHLPLKN